MLHPVHQQWACYPSKQKKLNLYRIGKSAVIDSNLQLCYIPNNGPHPINSVAMPCRAQLYHLISEVS